jgi:hypothetical protein
MKANGPPALADGPFPPILGRLVRYQQRQRQQRP